MPDVSAPYASSYIETIHQLSGEVLVWKRHAEDCSKQLVATAEENRKLRELLARLQPANSAPAAQG